MSAREPGSLYDEGVKRLEMGELDLAFKRLSEIYRCTPWFFRSREKYYVWEKLAFAYESNDQIEPAVRCLEIQARLQPDASDAFLNLGSFYQQRGRYDEAIEALMEGLQRTPNDEFLQYNLSQIFWQLEDVESSLAYLNGSIQANPNRPINHHGKGLCLLVMEAYDMATESFQRAIELCEPGNEHHEQVHIAALNGWASALTALGRDDQAQEPLLQAHLLAPGDQRTLLNLARLARRCSDFEEVIHFAGKILDQDSDQIRPLVLMAEALGCLGETDQALWFARRARRLAAGDPAVQQLWQALKKA